MSNKPKKSAATWLRQQLKIKGSTIHSGRGFYEMDYDTTSEELRKRIEAKCAKWQDNPDVERINLEPTLVQIYLSSATFGSYCRLQLRNGGLKLFMKCEG